MWKIKLGNLNKNLTFFSVHYIFYENTISLSKITSTFIKDNQMKTNLLCKSGFNKFSLVICINAWIEEEDAAHLVRAEQTLYLY